MSKELAEKMTDLEHIEPAISRLAKQGAQAIVMFPNALFVAEAARLLGLELPREFILRADRIIE